jgi:serine/threonine-protein kinase HipA
VLHDNAKPSAYRFSLANVQLKFSALGKANKAHANKRGGFTIPAAGVGGSWIVKLPLQQLSGVADRINSLAKALLSTS